MAQPNAFAFGGASFIWFICLVFRFLAYLLIAVAIVHSPLHLKEEEEEKAKRSDRFRKDAIMHVNAFYARKDEVKDKKEVEILVIELDNQRAGKENQKNNLQLSQKYPNCIFIRRMQFNYTIGRKKGDIGSSALVIQFPIRVCYAVSAHKIQGGTFEEPATVAMDLRSVFEPAQAYVMLSRVQAIEQLLIVENLPPEKIYASERALEEIRRLENISLHRNTLDIHSFALLVRMSLSLNHPLKGSW